MACVVQVFINSPSPSLDREFHYRVPEKYEGRIKIGMRVKVPFGVADRQMEAYVTDMLEETDRLQLKELARPIDDEPVLSRETIALSRYISENCFCTFTQAAHLFLPPGLEMKFLECVSLTPKADSPEGQEFIAKSAKRKRLISLIRDSGGSCETEQLRAEMGKGVSQIISALVKNEILEKSVKEKQKANEKYIRVVYYCGSEDPYELSRRIALKAPSQAAVIDLLAEGGEYTAMDIEAAVGASRSAVDALVEKGFAAYKNLEVLRRPADLNKPADLPKPLTEEQGRAVEAILSHESDVFLMHGVTGSGKTEVYMHCAAEVLARDKQVIILVPEIALTSQITDRFYRRFGDVVAVVHSALSMGERLDEWRRIKRGDAKIIVGARSAIFAPCENLGLIIVDEEHDPSYKSETTPRYHAKNIALMRGRLNKCKIVLASATPAVETYCLAERGAYELIELTERYNKNPLPEVELIDMRKELAEGNKTVLSRRLTCEISENLKNKEQSILLLNRRGYSTFVSCRECGHVFTCPDCSVSLTYHLSGNSMVCHMCGHTEPVPSHCPECGGTKVKDFGKGTQKAEAQLSDIFPDAGILRMDMDTTAGKRSHERLVESFRRQDADILLGTQMVAKGLDFENVTLVGVLSADSALNMNDFRAAERTFNLVTQVCGRAGRGEIRGRAIVQTYSPDNSTLRLAAKQDYKAFYREEIEYRRIFMYPPFCKLVNIIFSSSVKEEAAKAAETAIKDIREAIESRGVKAAVYGGGEAPIAKIQGRCRYRVWLKCSSVSELMPLLKRIGRKEHAKSGSDLLITIDINPNSMN
ncbi:MAG: primosomal protein N' [Oscillospiraceae bacterium]|nr:primosomal protein N' [Oscillospiraceae bacterium]